MISKARLIGCGMQIALGWLREDQAAPQFRRRFPSRATAALTKGCPRVRSTGGALTISQCRNAIKVVSSGAKVAREIALPRQSRVPLAAPWVRARRSRLIECRSAAPRPTFDEAARGVQLAPRVLKTHCWSGRGRASRRGQDRALGSSLPRGPDLARRTARPRGIRALRSRAWYWRARPSRSPTRQRSPPYGCLSQLIKADANRTLRLASRCAAEVGR